MTVSHYIKVSEAGVTQINGIYVHTDLWEKRPCYTLFGEGPTPDVFLLWGHGAWHIAVEKTTYLQYDFYRTIENIDWCYEIFNAAWELGGHPNTTLPLPVLEPSTGPDRPNATTLLIEGQVDPANMVDPTPTFAWNYIPANGGPPQDAYQIHVASSHLLLDAHQPDLWDNGIIESSVHQATYAGEKLGDLQMCFWAVRVRDTSGIWSDDWP